MMTNVLNRLRFQKVDLARVGQRMRVTCLPMLTFHSCQRISRCSGVSSRAAIYPPRRSRHHDPSSCCCCSYPAAASTEHAPIKGHEISAVIISGTRGTRPMRAPSQNPSCKDLVGDRPILSRVKSPVTPVRSSALLLGRVENSPWGTRHCSR